MKLLLITTQRCGSTWVAETLGDLLDAKFSYIPDTKIGRRVPRITAFEAGRIYGRLYYDNHIYKTHSIAIHHALQTANQANDLRIVSVRRDFKDVFVSRMFFERYCKPRKGERNAEIFRDYIAANKALDDVKFINGYLETPGFQRLVENWADLSVETSHPQHIRIDYEKMKNDPTAEASRLAEFVGADLSRVAGSIQRNHFRADNNEERSRFRRRGKIGDYNRFLTPEAVDFIDKAVERCLAGQPRYIHDSNLW